MDINNNLIAESARMAEKWGETGLLEGIEDQSIKRNTALLLENQKLLNESLTGGTDSSDVSQFRRISIPLVRRIYPQLIANKIVSVQPLLGPTGLVYYMRFRYGTDKGSTLGATNKDFAVGTAEAESITMQQQQDGDANLDAWYAHQRVNNEAVSGVIDISGDPDFVTFTLGHTPMLTNGLLTANVTEANANEALTASTTAGTPNYIAWGRVNIIDDSETATGYVDFAIRAGDSVVMNTSINGTPIADVTGVLAASVYTFNVADTATVGANVTLLTVTLNPSTGVMIFNFTNTEVEAADTFTLNNLVYEYDMECNIDLPEVNLVVESETISAKTRKLKAVWSFEAQQDLRSQHNVDAEAELTQILAKEINLEIDREIINDLRANAGTVATWDFATALGDTIKEKYESLYVKIVEISNIIHRKTLRGGANWLVTSPEVASIFETATAGFAPAPSTSFESSLGIQYVGTVNNRWRLYKDPLFPRGSILMGYRGDSYMDSGYFYCPYVPLTQTPVVLDPDSFCPRRGVLTRYGKKLLREGAKFYARVSIQNFII